jgi:hypothetical protein
VPAQRFVAMEEKRFSRTVRIQLAAFGNVRSVSDTHEALDCLIYCWPGERGPRHRDAIDACLKVIDGHRSTIDAEKAFVEAAREAGILEQGTAHR